MSTTSRSETLTATLNGHGVLFLNARPLLCEHGKPAEVRTRVFSDRSEEHLACCACRTEAAPAYDPADDWHILARLQRAESLLDAIEHLSAEWKVDRAPRVLNLVHALAKIGADRGKAL